MKTNIYLIPGYGELCDVKRYQSLITALKTKGHKVHCVDPDWHTPLSQQVFHVGKNAIVIGFSLGAILAYLVAKKHYCQKAIFASMTPVHKYPLKLWLKEVYDKDMPKDRAMACARDTKSIKIDLKNLKTPHVVLAGALEKEDSVTKPDLLVPKVGHRMTSAYADAIAKLL